MANSRSPRRSSRARPSSATLQHSSTSSSASSRKPDRDRLQNLNGSNPPSATPRSSPSASVSPDNAEPQIRQTRQKRRAQDILGVPIGKTEARSGEDDDLDDDEDGEDVTRCVCRRFDYPGVPVPVGEGSKKDPRNHPLAGTETLSGGTFIQCESCNVWQHGGCVCILDDAKSLEHYFCEQCRPDMHKVYTGSKGQRHSQYLPYLDTMRALLEKKEADNSVERIAKPRDADSTSSKDANGKSGVSNSITNSVKRRATMNSRFSYDEDEVLRKVLEESKGNGSSDQISGSKKKRSRDESDEDRSLKRRKIGSDSGSPPPLDHDGRSDSEGSQRQKRQNVAMKRSRPTTSSSQNKRETRHGERQPETVEVAGRRKARVDRGRVEDNVEELSKQASRITSSAKTSRQQPASKTTQSATASSTSHKKSTRTTGRKTRIGRNQYSKDREAAAEKAQLGKLPQSREGEDNEEDQEGEVHTNGSKPAKPRHMNPNRTSLNEMRKRAAGILRFISRTQVELAGEKTPSESNSPPSHANATASDAKAAMNGNSKLSNEVHQEIEQTAEQEVQNREGKIDPDKFKRLSSVKMMDVLTREIVLWQKEFGKWEK